MVEPRLFAGPVRGFTLASSEDHGRIDDGKGGYEGSYGEVVTRTDEERYR